MKVYLAGYISGNRIKECTEWRENLKNDKSLENINWIDPLAGKNFGSITPNGLKSDIPGKVFFYRDYHSVKNANVLVANLNTFGESRPMLGTFFEIAWAFNWKKPILTITKEDNYKFHPFIEHSSSLITDDIEEVKKMLKFYNKIHWN